MKKLHRRPSRFKGLTVGLDLHKSFTQYSVLDEAGDEVDADRIASRPQPLMKLIDRLTQDGQAVQITLEASGCFLWAYDLLVDRLGPEHVHVAAPSKVRVIADSMEKNDANDAWWLAYLLWEGRLPGAFVAEGDLRELRIASRELRSVVDERSDLKRRLKSHLAQLGLGFSASDWASTPGRLRIAKLVQEVEREHGVRGESVARLWDRIGQMDEEVDHWRGRVDALSSSFTEVKTLQQVLPGVGPQTAAVIWSPPEVAGRPASLCERQELREGDGPDAGLPRIGRADEPGQDHPAGQRSRALGVDACGAVVHTLYEGPGRACGAGLAGACPKAQVQEGGDRRGGAEAGRGGLASVRVGRGVRPDPCVRQAACRRSSMSWREVTC